MICEGVPIQAMNAMRMRQFVPRRLAGQAGVDPVLPELPNLDPDLPNIFREPYLGLGRRFGDGKFFSYRRLISSHRCSVAGVVTETNLKI